MNWLFHESDVDRLCNRMIEKHGSDVANIVLALCRQLDAGESIELESIDDREFRKRLRHLFEAFCLTPTKQTVVPGIAPVAKGFKKPSECDLRLAKMVKPRLVKAIEVNLEKELKKKRRAAQSPPEPIQQEEVSISQERLDFQRGIMESLAFNNEDETPQGEASQGSDDEPPEGPNDGVAGIMSLEEYREMKERGKDVVPMYTRKFNDDEDNVKSLMELRKEGTFRENTAEVLKYETMRQQQGEMWGKSQREQLRQMSKKRKLKEQGNESDDEEPWTRFDREKVFAGTRTGVSKAQFDEILEMTAENAANFKKAQ